MFRVRRTTMEDVPTLLKLAKMVHFINLPADKEIISNKVIHSRKSFQAAGEGKDGRSSRRARRTSSGDGLAATTTANPLFMFGLEDLETGSLIGTSQLVSAMGGPGHPTVYFELEKREKFSTSLQTGTTQIVARLQKDESGPTEIGGLILQPSFRGHKLKLGRLLSLVRFHFVALHRKTFADRVLAEMMAPITADGRNTLWEYLGRRFIPLSYEEADRFCQHSKEFMISLLPRDEIYLSLLPAEARIGVGQVGPETVPARRMLERLGFQYLDRIDPFDGGPLLEAVTDDIPTVRDTTRATVAAEPAKARDCSQAGIVSFLDVDGDFRAVETPFLMRRNGKIALPRQALTTLEIDTRVEVGVTPWPAKPQKKSSRAHNNGASRPRKKVRA